MTEAVSHLPLMCGDGERAQSKLVRRGLGGFRPALLSGARCSRPAGVPALGAEQPVGAGPSHRSRCLRIFTL